MANLNTLLQDRNLATRRGIERTTQGQIFYFTHTNVSGTINYTPCQFCWTSPGTGVAVVELWGAGGTGGRQCCCSTYGVPGNPGAYSKITTTVTGSSYICGWVGCSPTGNTLCYNGRSQCSTACLFNTGCNNVLVSQGGFGGYIYCSTSTAAYCCMAGAGFCNTLTNSFCGIICNWGGPNSACFACACGGDINICGGISCSRYWDCCQYWKCNVEETIAFPPGINSNCCSSCYRFFRSEWPGSGITNNGWAEMSVAVNGEKGAFGNRYLCWSGYQPCACYEFDGCRLNSAAMPGLTGIPCPNVRANGHKGGHGAIKITFYS